MSGQPYEAFGEDAEFDADDDVLITLSTRARKPEKRKPVKPKGAALQETSQYAMTYQPARSEGGWLVDALHDFYDNSMIVDVLRRIKGGKEATVYQCLAHPSLGPKFVAAKMYRPRMFRNLRNDADYRLGTQLRNAAGAVLRKSREQRAVTKRTKVGHKILHETWLNTELSTLQRLAAAGLSVPKVYSSSPNAILMDYFGSDSHAAAGLGAVGMPIGEATRLFARVLAEVEAMLRLNVVHGDLSPFNILYLDGDIRFIDFPQACHPQHNPNAWRFFLRDVTRVCDHFGAAGVPVNAESLARRIWRNVLLADPDDLRDQQRGRWSG